LIYFCYEVEGSAATLHDVDVDDDDDDDDDDDLMK
jgi:hypothetical protein